ncbi:MAG: carboxymuconolactone decarboxylase family protein [Geminicoccaceae bacterium]
MTATEPVETGPWSDALDQLRAWDPAWAEACLRMSTGPWRDGVLPRKLVELIALGLNAACTNLQADGTRRQIGRALAAGASREEILVVIKCATVMALHACSLGALILPEEAQAAGIAIERRRRPRRRPATG